MNTSRLLQIRSIAERVRQGLELDTFPVNVDTAVERLRGTIEEGSFGDAEAQIQKRGKGFVIKLAPTSSPERRRFSVAHELGHLFLHMGYLIDMPKWQSIDEYTDSPRLRFGHSEEEYEAHEFAGTFLMPEAEFRRYCSNYKKGDIYQVPPIAQRFGVSNLAAMTRGRWLGLFGWD